MPTGYTADIAKGITFQQYALSCARAFGALVLMRDDPSDAPIPDRFEPSDYNVNALKAARERLATLDAMSFDQSAEASRAAYLEALGRHEERIAEATELRNKYNGMLAQVVKWEPPTPDHVNYKTFMLDQIRESIDFDCRTDYYAKPEPMTGAQWLAGEIEKARRDVVYHAEENRKEVERTESRNAWIKALRDSL